MIVLKQKGRHVYFATEPPKILVSLLHTRLHYVKKGSQFMPNPAWANVYFYKKRTNSFPLGLMYLAKPILDRYCKNYDEEWQIRYENFIMPKSIITSDKLRLYQIEAIEALNKNSGGIIHLPTGSGKTFMCVEYLNQFDKKNKVLIVVPTLDLKVMWESQNIQLKTDVKTYQSITDFKQLENYDIVVFDECHHLPAKSLYNIAMKCHNAIMIGLSATPYREDGEEMRMFAALGPIIKSVTIRELIYDNFLVDAKIHIKMYEGETPDIFSEYHDVVNIHVVNNNDRNNEIVKLINKAPRPCLVLVDKIEHGEILAEKINCPFIHGKTKDRKQQLQRLKDGEYDVAVASKIYNEGVDVPILRSLVLAAGGKSAVKIVQQIGRVLRPAPGKQIAHIYDIFDNIKYLKNHSKERLKIYEENFEIEWIKEKN